MARLQTQPSYPHSLPVWDPLAQKVYMSPGEGYWNRISCKGSGKLFGGLGGEASGLPWTSVSRTHLGSISGHHSVAGGV